MKTITSIIIVGATVTALAFGANAYAKRDGGHRGDKMVSQITKRLELDDSQAQALEALQAEILETRALMSGSDGNLKEQLSAMIAAETFDQGEALSLINQRAEAFQANAPELVATAGTFIDSLNAEQKATVQKFMDRGGKRGFGRKHHRNGDDSNDE
jgi:Spy/CpxP family protein refolding chaperone